jgi:putative ABC transport system permease protein
VLKPEWWFAGIAISVLGALGCVRRQPDQGGAHARARLRAAASLAAGAAALAETAGYGRGARICSRCRLLWFGDTLIAGFAVLAALMLGAALALPAILERVLALGEEAAQKPLARWFWADSRQQLSGLSLALMALLLALAVNVGVATMVESFSRTFVTWLDGRLASDVYVFAKDDKQAGEIRAWLRERPEVQAILPTSRADGNSPASRSRCLASSITQPTADYWPLLESAPNAWARLRPGDAAFISEQLARRMKLAIGDRIEMPATSGNWPLEIVGIYADYGNPKGQITVNYAALTALSRTSADPLWAARRAVTDSGADIGDAGKIFAR